MPRGYVSLLPRPMAASSKHASRSAQQMPASRKHAHLDTVVVSRRRRSNRREALARADCPQQAARRRACLHTLAPMTLRTRRPTRPATRRSRRTWPHSYLGARKRDGCRPSPRRTCQKPSTSRPRSAASLRHRAPSGRHTGWHTRRADSHRTASRNPSRGSARLRRPRERSLGEWSTSRPNRCRGPRGSSGRSCQERFGPRTSRGRSHTPRRPYPYRPRRPRLPASLRRPASNRRRPHSHPARSLRCCYCSQPSPRAPPRQAIERSPCVEREAQGGPSTRYRPIGHFPRIRLRGRASLQNDRVTYAVSRCAIATSRSQTARVTPSRVGCSRWSGRRSPRPQPTARTASRGTAPGTPGDPSPDGMRASG